ncbi:hypothetical protein Asi03nite_73310 [Actinoplanes siamensis]|uniref:Uncharacterized protein n=1 Tax=Actinoplanes siamensis TaxID=1223317 RepID=A0A919NEK7_9ACTN|nr:hypothetical protein Asi03nite_73310 [Actinoplanes siamensis]
MAAASGGAVATPPAPPAKRCADTVAEVAAAQVTARLCGKRVGVCGATTETDLLFVNPDGTRPWSTATVPCASSATARGAAPTPRWSAAPTPRWSAAPTARSARRPPRPDPFTDRA